MSGELTGHTPNCDWHTDHYPWECTCGFNKTKDTAAAWQSGYEAGIEAAASIAEHAWIVCAIDVIMDADAAHALCQRTAETIRAALEARGLEIREKGQ